MFPIRVKTVQESDLRMLGDLARNIQRVLPVTQADIDAAAALGKGWVVWKVVEVNDPIDNLRGGTQLVIKQNSITPGQNVRRVLIVSGPGGETVVIGPGPSPLLLPDAIADSLSYVKAFGGTEQRSLPQGYQQLVSLTTDNASYFDTDYIINSFDVDITTDAAMTLLASGPNMLWGFMGSSGNLPRWGVGSYSGNWLYGANATQSTSAIDADTSRHTSVGSMFYAENVPMYGLTVDGAAGPTMSLSNAELMTNNTLSIFIGARNNRGTAGNFNPSTFYSFKIEKAGELVVNMVPAKRLSDNVVGFYDTVRDRFFINAGTGTITAGNVAVPTPNTPMDIISNNGALVFRDTELPTAYRRILGMTMDNDCYYEITGFKMNGSDTLRFSFTRTGAYACNVLGAYDGTSAQSNYSLYAGGTSGASYLRYNGGAYNSYAIADKKYDVVMTPTGSDGMENDSTWTAKTFTSTTNLCIGTTSPSATSSKMVGSIHGSVVVDSRLELIPCERISDGELGYYDTYTDTFYEPIGTTPTSLGYDYTKCDIVAAGPVETIEDTIGNTATAEILLKVGDYQDQQEILSGAITRNVGIKVLDGTENFETATATNCYSLTNTLGTGNFSNRTIVCSHFASTPTLPSTSARQGLAFIVNKGSEYTIAFGARTQFSTLTLWTQWLADQYAAGTPVIVIYPLATPTTESVTGQTLQVTDGDNTLEITQASLPGLELEAEYTKVA